MESAVITDVEKDIDLKSEDTQYAVVFYNDDITPFDFVVALIELIFGYEKEKAFMLTMAVHTTGSAMIAIYPLLEMAENQANRCRKLSRANGYPLKIEVEKV